MHIIRYAGTGLLIGCCFWVLCLSAIPAMAQSGTTSQPAASLPAYINEGPIPGGYIIGYVLDEDGTPVPGAQVSLLLDSQLWDPGKYNYPESGRNPQVTRTAYYDTDGLVHEGGFLFGLPLPDDYTLVAEKYDYKGSAVVHVPRELLYNDTTAAVSKIIMVNITLKGSHQPTFTPEQLAYNGVVIGKITNLKGYHTVIRNISLLQDGRLVPLPNNPQNARYRHYKGQDVDYIFEHLAPGRYTITVEYDIFHPQGPPMYNDSVTVDVGTDKVTANMELSHIAPEPPGPMIPTPGETPVPAEKAAPSPALSWPASIFALGLVVCLIIKIRR